MRRRELETHRRKIGEIRGIMSSMKTLAAIEMHRLDRRVAAQAEMEKQIAQVAADFLFFHPSLLPEIEPPSRVVLAVGSERGFCGEFNARVAEALSELVEEEQGVTHRIVVGGKLHSLFDPPGEDCLLLTGAEVAEEIVAVLDSVAAALAGCGDSFSFLVVHHASDDGTVAVTRLLPPFLRTPDDRRFPLPPLLNIPAEEFLVELTDQFLFTRLVQILYSSLMLENQFRTRHLERAIRHLDDSDEELGRKINMLRQEEIIEEIEVMLLNAVER